MSAINHWHGLVLSSVCSSSAPWNFKAAIWLRLKPSVATQPGDGGMAAVTWPTMGA